MFRTEIDFALAATEPRYLEPDSVYSSYPEKIVAWSPICTTGFHATYVPYYSINNKDVWKLISNICRDEDYWTRVKSYPCKKDGWNAFLALWTYYLDKKNVNKQGTTSGKYLELASWTQNSNHYKFDDF